MSIVLTNFQNTTLAAASASGSTSFTLSSSANLPTLTAGQIMPLVLNDAATGAIFEVVYVTAISGAVLTVTRAQEGTTAQNWNIGDFAYCSPTAETLATINGSSSQVFSAANATAGTQEVVPISQADTRYTPSGADGSAPLVSVASAGTIAINQVGNRFLLNGNATLPTPVGNGGAAIWCKNANVASTLTTPAGLIYTSDGGNAATTWTMPASADAWVILVSDGSNWAVLNLGGRTIVANAANANEAVALGQADGRYTPIAFSQVGPITAATTLTAAQSGITFEVAAATAAYNITLPAPFSGARYRFFGVNGTYAVNLTYTGNIFLPDGNAVAAGTFSQINLAAPGNSVEVWSDADNWLMQNIGGQPIIKNAVAANQPVTLGQVLGIGQSWQTVSRVSGTTYTNSTNKAIVLTVMTATNVQSYGLSITVSGVVVASIAENFTGAINQGCVSAIIPSGATYGFTASGSPGTVVTVELR